MSVKYSEEIISEDIKKLVSSELSVLVIKNFYPKQVCRKIVKEVLSQPKDIEKYTHEVIVDGKVHQEYFGVDRLGVPFNLTYNGNALAKKRYYHDVTRAHSNFRQLSKPLLAPIDLLRLQLDERYNLGATIASFEGLKMRAGIIRITESKYSHMSEEQPHFDALPLKYAELNAQLAANIYLDVPEEGGELEVWDVQPLSPLDKTPSNWRNSLMEPIRIKPAEGDLIIFNCRMPHAIRSFKKGKRITAQVFIGIQQERPLQLWN